MHGMHHAQSIVFKNLSRNTNQSDNPPQGPFDHFGRYFGHSTKWLILSTAQLPRLIQQPTAHTMHRRATGRPSTCQQAKRARPQPRKQDRVRHRWPPQSTQHPCL